MSQGVAAVTPSGRRSAGMAVCGILLAVFVMIATLVTRTSHRAPAFLAEAVQHRTVSLDDGASKEQAGGLYYGLEPNGAMPGAGRKPASVAEGEHKMWRPRADTDAATGPSEETAPAANQPASAESTTQPGQLIKVEVAPQFREEVINARMQGQCKIQRESYFRTPVSPCKDGLRFNHEFVTTQLYGRQFNPYVSTGSAQMVVLGQHKSGTSILTRFLMMMGAFAGDIETMSVGRHNRLKYWEKWNVFNLHQRVLMRVVDNELPAWVGSGIDWRKLPPQDLPAIQASIKATVVSLNRHRPWVLKDPRMCWTFQFWKPYLDKPVCVLIHNTNVPKVALRIALTVRALTDRTVDASVVMRAWEGMMVHALAACRGLPTALLPTYNHRANATMPFLADMIARLQAAGVAGLVLPSEHELNDNVLKYYELGKQRPGWKSATNHSLPVPTHGQAALIAAFQQELDAPGAAPAHELAARVLDRYRAAAGADAISEDETVHAKVARS